MTVDELAALIDDLAPQAYAADWDNVGLLIGDGDSSVRRVLFALDLSHDVVDEALESGAETICVHHPIIFHPLKRLVATDPIGSIVLRAASSGLKVIAAHTNLDSAVGGVNDALAAALGLPDPEPLIPEHEEQLKLVTFAPAEAVTPVIDALSAAGCGIIGNYTHCSFRSPGTGTFIPTEYANPYSGERGQLSEEPEFRIEVVLPANRLAAAVTALMAAHPYDEPAHDIYALRNSPVPSRAHASGPPGLGRISTLKEEAVLSVLVDRWCDKLQISAARICGDADHRVRRVAVCGGSASSVVAAAARSGADVLVGGEFSYHDSTAADHHGISLVALGHDTTEALALPAFRDMVRAKLSEQRIDIATAISTRPPSSWKWYPRRKGGQ